MILLYIIPRVIHFHIQGGSESDLEKIHLFALKDFLGWSILLLDKDHPNIWNGMGYLSCTPCGRQ